ncbi:MAG: hypothetical protein MRERC_2c120 [Mycoplasmataceae bacterium RC_NB112A]|nr:MAG: hypothetical protein MRERC_2c120 [Mycoplasmataceae bacterium RC_NB112A]
MIDNTTNNNSQEERKEILKKKDFSNGKSLAEWLVLAKEAVEENSQLIAENKEVFDVEKLQEENNFIYEALSSLQSSEFFEEITKKIEGIDDEQKLAVIGELKNVMELKKEEIGEIKKIIEESNSHDNEKNKRNSSIINLRANLKQKRKRESQIISNLPMNSNKEVIKNIKELLALGKEKLEQNTEAEPLLEQIERAFQENDDDKLKIECEKLYNDFINNDEYNGVITFDNGLSKTLWRYYLDKWYTEEPSQLSDEQKEKLEDYDKTQEELEELKQKYEELRKEKEELEERVDNERERRQSIILTPTTPIPTTPMTPGLGLMKDEDRQEILAQDWLKNNCEKEKENVYEIMTDKSWKLTGDLVIKDYPNLELISLQDMKINKLVIEGCPNVEEIEVYGNELTEIVGLENLSKLRKIACGNNQINKLDVNENKKLAKLLVFDNPTFPIIGLQNLSLTEFKGDRNNKIDLIRITKEELEEAAKELGIDEKKLENKSKEEIKRLIQEEGNIIRENESKLNDLDKGLPGLLNQERKVDDKKLKNIKEEIKKVEELRKEIRETRKKVAKVEQEKNKVQKELKEEKQLAKMIEEQLMRFAGKDDAEEIKQKAQKNLKRELEKIEANIEINKNK